MGVLQYCTANAFAAQDGEEPNLVKCLIHFQTVGLDNRYLELLGFGRSYGMKPNFPAPSTKVFNKVSIDVAAKMSVTGVQTKCRS